MMMKAVDKYEQRFRALGDSTRLQILEMLREQPLNAGEILSKVEVVQSTLSHHMKILCESGMVKAVRSGKNVIYSLDPEALMEACDRIRMLAGETPKQAEDSAGFSDKKVISGYKDEKKSEEKKKDGKNKEKHPEKPAKNKKDSGKHGKKSKDKGKNKKK